MKNKPRDESDEAPVGNRSSVKYVLLPLGLWKRVREIADAEERSVAWVVRKAVREFLERGGK